MRAGSTPIDGLCVSGGRVDPEPLHLQTTHYIRVDQRFDEVDRRFEQVDKRFEQVDKRFEQVDLRLDRIDGRLDTKFGPVHDRLDGIQQSMVHAIVAFTAAAIAGFVAVAGLIVTQL